MSMIGNIFAGHVISHHHFEIFDWGFSLVCIDEMDNSNSEALPSNVTIIKQDAQLEFELFVLSLDNWKQNGSSELFPLC